MKTGKNKTIIFDTLAYSQRLKKYGIKHAEVFAISLAEALNQNLYTKSEVKQMYEEELKKFEARTLAIEKETAMRLQEMHERTYQLPLEISLQIERMYRRAITTTIGTLGSLIVIVGAISTFAHVIFR